MTLEEVVSVVEDETGRKVVPESKLSGLGMDSLDFLSLMTRLSIPDLAVIRMNTVYDLYKELGGA